MLKVCVLGNDEGGIYAFRRELIATLVGRGVTVIVGFPWAGHSMRIRELGCETINTRINRHGTSIVEDMRLLMQYIKLFRGSHPDIVLTHTIKPNVYASLACQICGVPYINNITGLGATFQKDTLLMRLVVALQRWAYRKSSCVFFQNRANMERFLQMGVVSQNTPMRLLPGSGVNLSLHRYEPFPADDGIIRFVTVARIQRTKGYDELFCAARRVKAACPNTEFHIAGRFEEVEYKGEVERLAQDGTVTYHGEMLQEEVHRLIAQCNCLIHPSYHEGMSNVCLEAAATGRPVLASNIPGCRETFDDGITGIGFAPRNADSLVEAIERFLRLSKEERRAMGLRGREKMEREFDRRIVVDAYLEEIERVLSRK